MSQQPASDATLEEVRRLLAERARKKRELDALDQAIEHAAGISGSDDRPRKPRISRSDFRNMCGARV